MEIAHRLAQVGLALLGVAIVGVVLLIFSFVLGMAAGVAAAVFVALLQLEDGAINERLSGLRGRLTATEAAAVWNEFDAGAGSPSSDFIAEWQACA